MWHTSHRLNASILCFLFNVYFNILTITNRSIRALVSVKYNRFIISMQGGELMDDRNNDFDFDFMPIGQAIKRARTAQGMTREQLSRIVDYDPMRMVFSKSKRFRRRLLIVIFVVAPLSKELSSSEYSRNIASLSSRLATA